MESIVHVCLAGLSTGTFIWLVASGLTLIFGVLGVLNFAHGSFYMLGAYLAYQLVQWGGRTPGRFWWAVLGAALARRRSIHRSVLARSSRARSSWGQSVVGYAHLARIQR